MRWARLLLALVTLPVAGCLVLPRSEPPASRIVDLTHTFDARTVYWPTEEGFVHERGAAGPTPAGHYYEAHRFRAAEHGGTHVDAPIHFYEGAASVEEISLERLVGPGVVVDVSRACAEDPDHRVGLDDLRAFEARHGVIPHGAIVLLRTGFAARWPDRERYMGTAERGAAGVAALHFPGLGPEAARWLVEERLVGAVGIDTPSIDHGPSQDFATHIVLAAAGVPVFENVAITDALPATGFRVFALPMKIGAGSGAPLRIIALIP